MNKRSIYIAATTAIVIMLAFFFLSFRPASQDEGTYATMRVYENFSVVVSKIVVTYADGQTEIIELGPFKYNDEFMKDNNQIMNRAMNMMADKGYRLVTSSSSGKINSSKSVTVSTHIFEKR
jgi:hypothetical protein